MGKMMMFCCLFLAIWAAYANTEGLKEEESSLQKLCHVKQKVARLHFYIQDIGSGPNATIWEVARSNITSDANSSFGLVRVVDWLITAEPDRNSDKLGRAQGLITFSDMTEFALTMTLNFYFTGGEYSGSTLCVLGRNPTSRQNRELSVVGGTGVFRMAQGYCIFNTFFQDAATKYFILEYNIYVVYPEEQPQLELL